jgi:molybdopterin converting factor small subunit
MRIRFYANMRTLVGQDVYDVANMEGGNTLGSLLANVVEQFPEIRMHILDSAGNLRPDIPFFVDGRNPRLGGEGLDTWLDSNAEISIFSPISSGRMNVEVMRNSFQNSEEHNHES